MADRPTMEDVATRAGVSRALVSLVMNNSPRVSEKKRRAVLRAAQELGYRPNLHARNLAQKRTRTIGVVVNDLHNPFFSEVLDGIESETELADMKVLVLNGGRDAQREQGAIETYLQFRVEALVLVGSRVDDQQLAAAAQLVPCVVVAAGRHYQGVDTVTTDDATGAQLAIRHLVELGHTRIAHLDGGPNVSALARRDGYLKAMESLRLAPHIVAGGDDEEASRRSVHELLKADESPTAIFAFNDLLAAGVLDCLDDVNLAVPGQMSLVGYDNTFIAGLHRLSLTTINQPRMEMGRLAVATVMERINDERTEAVARRLEPSLVVRGTTAPPHDGADMSTRRAARR